jgi:hypothetical protein
MTTTRQQHCVPRPAQALPWATSVVCGDCRGARHQVVHRVDGLIYASSMVMLDSARRRTSVPALARWLLGLGIAATLAANVAHGLGHGPVGAAVAAWPAIVLVGSYELLTTVIHSSHAAHEGGSGIALSRDPLQEQVAEVFAGDLAADRVPSIREIRAQLHVGQPGRSGCETISQQERGELRIPLRE